MRKYICFNLISYLLSIKKYRIPAESLIIRCPNAIGAGSGPGGTTYKSRVYERFPL